MDRRDLRKRWNEHGTLWTDRDDARLTGQIRRDFAEQFGPCTRPMPSVAYNAQEEQGDHSGADGMTLDEIGEALGLSRSRVQQIEARALRKLRKTIDGLEKFSQLDRYQKDVHRTNFLWKMDFLRVVEDRWWWADRTTPLASCIDQRESGAACSVVAHLGEVLADCPSLRAPWLAARLREQIKAGKVNNVAQAREFLDLVRRLNLPTQAAT